MPTPNRAEWLAWRRDGIGGSDVAAIVGLSPWASAYSVWAEKVGLVAGRDDSPAMEFGRRAEPMLAAWFTDDTGLDLGGQQQQHTHPLSPWMRCTIDGYTVADGACCVVEFKTTSDDEWDEVPAGYICQAQWNMAVTDAAGCWFGVLHLAFGRPRFRTYYVPRSEPDIAYITDRCSRFWHDHVLTGQAPEADGHEATTNTLNAMWDTTDGTIDATDDLRRAVATRAHAKAEAQRWEDVAAAAANTIRQAMGAADAIKDGTRNLATWRWQDRPTVDVAAIRAADPDLVAAHTTTTRSRVLRINKG